MSFTGIRDSSSAISSLKVAARQSVYRIVDIDPLLPARLHVLKIRAFGGVHRPAERVNEQAVPRSSSLPPAA